MSQKIIDLDSVIPDDIKVRIDGELYSLPGDIPVPTYLAISQATERLEAAQGDEAAGLLRDLYQRIVSLFEELNELPLDADGNPELAIGPRRLGALLIQIYSAEEEEPQPDRPTRTRGTRSTSQKKPRKSPSSR